jgi:hypothetical protein
MDIAIGDVVVTRSGEIGVITDFNSGKRKYPWIYKVSLTKQYKGRLEDFISVIAFEADIDELTEMASEKMLSGQAAGPSTVKDLKIGDSIKVKVRGRIEEVAFAGYKPRNRKYPLIYKASTGRMYKTRLDALQE